MITRPTGRGCVITEKEIREAVADTVRPQTFIVVPFDAFICVFHDSA